MDFKSELAQFRQSFAQKEAQIKQEVRSSNEPVEPAQPDAIWADEIAMPVQGNAMPLDESFSSDVEVPDLLTDSDTRFTGDKDMDTQAFMEYLENDPIIQQHGPEMEALLEEIVSMAQDPEHPMTNEEAQSVFLEMMEEQFGQYFK